MTTKKTTNAAPDSITEKAMLASLSISYWTGKASDDQVEDELTTKHSTDRDVHEYKKRLIKAEAINQFKAVRSRARAYHLDKTLPWIDGGTRILPAALYFDYAAAMGKFREEYNEEVRKFIKNYPQLKLEAKKRLGTLFKETDYPAVESLPRKFGWDFHVFPIPAAKDWRVDFSNSKEGAQTRDEMMKQVDQKVKEALHLATRDLWTRLHTVIQSLAEKARDPDAKFKNSIIGNIRELIELLPKMNVTGDIELEKMRQRVEKELCKIDPDELREDEKTRKQTSDAADKILKAMAGYVGGAK